MIRPPPGPTPFPYTTLFRSIGHAEATAHMADQAFGKGHDAVGNAAIEHQLAREDEERDGQEREDVHARCHALEHEDRKSTRLNSSHLVISYAVFCLKKKNHQ